MEMDWTGRCRRGSGRRGAGRARPAQAQLLHTRRHPCQAASKGRGSRRTRLTRHGVEPMRAGKTFEFDITTLVELNVVMVAHRIAHHLADKNLAAVGLACHARRHSDVTSEQIIAATYRLTGMD